MVQPPESLRYITEMGSSGVSHDGDIGGHTSTCLPEIIGMATDVQVKQLQEAIKQMDEMPFLRMRLEVSPKNTGCGDITENISLGTVEVSSR